MGYSLIVTEHAEELLNGLVHYLLYRLENEQAAVHLFDGIEKIYSRLEKIHTNFQRAGIST